MEISALCNEHINNSKLSVLDFSISSDVPYSVNIKGIQRVPCNLINKNYFHDRSDDVLQRLLFLSELCDITKYFNDIFFYLSLHHKQLLAKSSYICILDCTFGMSREHLIHNLVIWI